jgi:hypothetical protein
MNVSEATATKVLLGAVLGMPAVEGIPAGDEATRQAAVFLATLAHETLGGGLDAEAVASRWARRIRSGIAICEWCREVRETVARCVGCGEELCLRCWADGNDLLCGVCRHRRRPAFDDVVVTSGVL